MNQASVIIPILILSLCIQSCGKDGKDEVLITCSKNDVIIDSLNGTWNLISTSGGINGGGYSPNFDKIKFDCELNFEMIKMGNVMANGHVEKLENQYFEHFIRFITEEVNINGYIDILNDNEKGVIFEADKLRLRSGKIDGFDTEFERE